MAPKKAKPDYIDIDGDGNKTESMKKAVKDKKKTPVKRSLGGSDARGMGAATQGGKFKGVF